MANTILFWFKWPLQGVRSQNQPLKGLEGWWGHPWVAPKWPKMVTQSWPLHDQAKVSQNYPEWLIWSNSGLNGHLKGDRSQNQPLEGLKGWWGHPWGAPKWTKMVILSWPWHDKAKLFRICPMWLIQSNSDSNGPFTGLGVRISHWGGWGVVGRPMGCTNMDQNGNQLSPWHEKAKVSWIRPKLLIQSNSHSNGH